MKIVILDGHTLNPGDLSWDGIRAFGETMIYQWTAPENTVEHIGDSDVVLTNKTELTGDVIRSCPNIRYIGCLSTGYNVVDLEAANERGILVTNIPAYSTDAVAQFTFALLLEMASRVGIHAEAVSEGQWSQCKDFCFWNKPLMELKGKTMGIIGFGAIGQAVAKLAVAFGMKVLAYRRHPDPALDTKDCQQVSLEEVYRCADILSLHCPLNEDSREMINKDSLSKMKRGVILINTGRGPLIREADLREALESGQVAMAAADVVSVEPIKETNPLLGAPNMIITPHIAWAPLETRQRLMGMAVENLQAYKDGHPIHVVNGTGS